MGVPGRRRSHSTRSRLGHLLARSRHAAENRPPAHGRETISPRRSGPSGRTVAPSKPRPAEGMGERLLMEIKRTEDQTESGILLSRWWRIHPRGVLVPSRRVALVTALRREAIPTDSRLRARDPSRECWCPVFLTEAARPFPVSHRGPGEAVVLLRCRGMLQQVSFPDARPVFSIHTHFHGN